MFQADPRGILALVAVAMCWVLALVLYRVAAPGSVGRKLSLLLVIEGITLGSSSALEYLLVSPDEWLGLHPGWDKITDIVHLLGDCAMLSLYPPFLAAALQTKLTRPFADKRMRIVLAAASIALFFAVLFTPPPIGPLLLFLALTLLFGFALIASIHAWHVARGVARTRAGVFVLAFGFRDICWGAIYVAVVREILSGTLVHETILHQFNVYAMGTLFAVPLIAYGILRTQLFDIDLRIRWTIKQSTLATVVVTLIFLLSEGADRFLSAELGNFAGLLAAAVVVFFLAPLQRFAESVASIAMPNTKNTPEYTTFRKMQVYEEAVSEAHYQGGISEKERSLLVRLRDSLGISESDADAIEGELTKLQPGVA
jgi:hypothetical protein